MHADTVTPDPTNPGPTGTAPALVDLPARDVLAVDGRGAPEDPPFTGAVSALFATRFTLGADQDVPLEGTYSQGGSRESDDGQPFDLTSPHQLGLAPARARPAARVRGRRGGRPERPR